MKIGVYGGTFNPPHLGHITAAKAVFDLLNLDKLLLIPTGQPPHKELPSGAPTAEQRLELARLAAEEIGEAAEVLDIEVHREGRSYTADTLAQLHQQYPEDELWLLMGTDMFLTLQDWRAPGEILSLAGVAAFGRTEADTEELFSVQREYLQKAFPQARIFTLTVPGVVDVSSSEIREELAQGRGGALLAPRVYGTILRQGLYGVSADMKALPLERLRPVALTYLHHRRVPHVLGTEAEAVRLAERWGGGDGELIQKARRAALLHDSTKRLDMEEQKALCAQYGIALDALEEREVKLLHARTGAAIARDVFGEPAEIVDAIRWHTTGRADMTLLEKIIYLADYIEPTRHFPGVEDLRRRCYEDLDGGLLMGLDMTIQEMTERGSPIHRATLEARDWLKGQRH